MKTKRVCGAIRSVQPARPRRLDFGRGHRRAERGTGADRVDRSGRSCRRFASTDGSGSASPPPYGWRYDFDTASFGPADPIPDWLLPLRQRAAGFARLAPDQLVQALVIRYDPGAGIGWHRDRPVFEHVVGISLGAPATMRFRRRRPGGFDRRSALLAPRSIYHLAGEARQEWEHSIAEIAVTRWSITFRSLSKKARAAP